MRYGVKSVTMDDVAREAGMSKKTIYQHFTDRNGLVESAVEYLLNSVEEKCQQICDEFSNPIDQLLEIGRYFHALTRQMNPSLFLDLRRYFPVAWKRLTEYRSGNIEKQVKENLERGQKLGLYRTDFDLGIITRIYIKLIDLITDDELFPKTKWTFKELHREILMYHLHSISTPLGINYLNEKKITHE